MQELTMRSEFEAILSATEAILLKHGATCPISVNARAELAAFRAAHPDVPVYTIEVTANRQLSSDVAQRLGVPHESPQAFVLRDGRAGWHAEHYEITALALAAHLESPE
jgi:thioredoxin 1